jgi:hypothetical protein
MFLLANGLQLAENSARQSQNKSDSTLMFAALFLWRNVGLTRPCGRILGYFGLKNMRVTSQ